MGIKSWGINLRDKNLRDKNLRSKLGYKEFKVYIRVEILGIKFEYKNLRCKLGYKNLRSKLGYKFWV